MNLTATAAPTDPSPDTALASLRAATRTRHDRIDHQLALGRMAEPGHYVRVLQVFDAFLPPWEAAVAAALPVAFRPWLRQRSRRSFLAADLSALGAPASTARAAVPALAGPAAAWGSLYVMEGSALGGQVITRALAARGLGPANGAAYFHGWGDATGAMWREFRDLLAGQLRQPADIAAACAAAQSTFDALSACFEAHLDERTALA